MSTKSQGKKLIFLDFDGVINGYTPLTLSLLDTFRKLGILKHVKKHYDIFGAHILKVYHLAQIVRWTGADVVLSSSWRKAFYTYYDKNKSDPTLRRDKTIEKLHFLFKIFRINVIGYTPTVETPEYHSHREYEIKQWLETYPYHISNFVVLDDESADLKGFIGTHLVQTSKVIESPTAYKEWLGLRTKHVIQAIKILNSKKGALSNETDPIQANFTSANTSSITSNTSSTSTNTSQNL